MKLENEFLIEEFVSELLLLKCYENTDIESVIKNFKINESDETCIKLEVALATKSNRSLLPTVEMVFKNKNLDKLHEKIAWYLNMVFEFIEKTILSYQNSISRITSSTRMMKILDISTVKIDPIALFVTPYLFTLFS